MALYDNKHWLLSHVRNSFISSDDTGMSEAVMMGENIPQQMEKPKYSVYPGLGDSDEDDDLDILSQSIDIHSDLRYGLLRYRSNTASKLQRMEQARKIAAQTKIVKWKKNQSTLQDSVNSELFVKKDVKPTEKLNPSDISEVVSASVMLMQNYSHLSTNPYQQYAKFDGNAQVGVGTRKYKIFVHILPQEQRNYPMEVVIVVGTRVSDLIGLVLWQCFIHFPEVELKQINSYALYIAENDGEVDYDFPNLESSEYVTKFAFAYLALIERESNVHITNRWDESRVLADANNLLSTKLDIETTNVTATNVATSSSNNIDSSHCELAHQNSLHNLEAPIYQSYSVNLLNKFRKTEVLLGVSGDKIEIDPLTISKSSTKLLWGKQKPVAYDIESIVACDLTQNKSNKATFRLVYDQVPESNNTDSNQTLGSSVMTDLNIDTTNHHFKHYDFEVDYKIADEIVHKINYILDLRTNPKRKEYLAIREKKAHRRKSFSFPR